MGGVVTARAARFADLDAGNQGQMKLVALGCIFCGAVTSSLDGVCERCDLDRSPSLRARARRKRVRVQRALPRKHAA